VDVYVTLSRTWLLVLVLFLAGCGALRSKPDAGTPMQIYTLYFGMSVKGRPPISAREWQHFRDQVITPALPDGYTVFDGQGAWRSPGSSRTISEATKVLQVAMPDMPESLATITRLRLAGQQRLFQSVIGMTVQNGRGSFTQMEAPK
jgi:Protein of unknown function (DUF3574)